MMCGCSSKSCSEMSGNDDKSLESHIKNFLVVFLGMLLEKGMVYQLLYSPTFVRVLLQTFIQEIPDFSADEQVRRYFDLIFDDFYELFFSCYFEGVLSYDHLVHHDADRPDIDFLVVLFSFEDFGADVEGCSTKGGPQFIILMHRPAKIA